MINKLQKVFKNIIKNLYKKEKNLLFWRAKTYVKNRQESLVNKNFNIKTHKVKG